MSLEHYMTTWVIYLAAALIGLLLFRRLGLGSVLGFLVAGVVIGPFGFGVVGDPEGVLHFSEFGVVMLLFVIGLELEPARLWEMRKDVFGAGGLQWLLSAFLITGVALAFGLTWQAALVLGLALALSSTAFALQVLNERNEMACQHGRTGFSVLLLQDLAVVPLLALVPLLAPGHAESQSVWPGLLFLVFLVVAGRFLLRPALRLVAKSRSPEAFTGAALLLVLGVALAMEAGGLSMALGAFMAGILLADSEYRHELESAIQPFKALLLALFFIAVGATVELPLLAQQWQSVLLLVGILIGIKGGVLLLLAKRLHLGAYGGGVLALSLSQGGEFAFVVLAESLDAALIDAGIQKLLVLVVSLSMATTPILLFIFDRFIAPRLGARRSGDYDQIEQDNTQVIIAGFGRFGQIIGRTLLSRKIPFTALDRDADHVDFMGQFGSRIFYGDAARLDLLRAAGAEAANALVVAVDDPENSISIVELCNQHFPQLKVFARARNRIHAYRLMELGCTQVYRENYGSSLEAAEAVLTSLGLTSSNAANTVRRFRIHDEDLMQRAYQHHRDFDKLLELAKEGRAELKQLFEQDEDHQEGL